MSAPPPVPGPGSQLPTVARLIPGAVSPARLAALRTGAVIARAEAAVVTLTGPGAVTAAQGLLTNDVEKPGDGAFVYGALLTPKGMIVVDAWVARLGATIDRKSTRLNSSHSQISYAVFCLKKKKNRLYKYAPFLNMNRGYSGALTLRYRVDY